MKNIISSIKSEFLERREKEKNIKNIKKAGVWFVDVPRTSSSSIKVELGQKFGFPYGKNNLIEKEFSSTQMLKDHITAREMKSYVGDKNWSSLYTFSIVRNPWDRAFSLYKYRKIAKRIPQHWTFEEYIKSLIVLHGKDSEYFKEPHQYYGAYDFIYSKEDTCLVNKIVRFENREVELQEVSEKLNFNLGDFHLQSSNKSDDYRSYYNANTKKAIEVLYQKDIETFKYSF